MIMLMIKCCFLFQFAGNISKFAHTFSIPATVVKQIQGFWLLDHQDFEVSEELFFGILGNLCVLTMIILAACIV